MGRIGNSVDIIRYRSVVAALRFAGDPSQLAHAIRHLGDAYRQAGQAALAEPCYVEALAIYRGHEGERPLDLANAIRSFAVLRDEGGAALEAQQLWLECHQLYTAVGVPAGIAESAARLALLARHQGDLPRSRDWLDKAMAAASASDDAETRRYVNEVEKQVGE